MPTVVRFEDLVIWQKARTLSKDIFDYIECGGFKKDFSLIGQINRASGSVMDNVSEGFERNGRLEFIQFLSVAKGYIGEVKSQLYRALDRQYLTQEKFKFFYEQADSLTRQIAAFIAYLNQSTTAGQKYKKRM